MALSQYDIKRIAAEIIAQQNQSLSSKVTKAVNAAIEDATDEWYTTAQACRFLRMSERQLYKLKAEGVIPFSKPRGRVYFRKSNLIAYMDNIK